MEENKNFKGDVTRFKGLGEVDPEDIRKFFDLYQKYGGTPRDILQQVYQLGAEAKDMYVFMRDMQRIKEFFQPFYYLPLFQLKGFRKPRHLNTVMSFYPLA